MNRHHPLAERLESRTLLTTLPTGFQMTHVTSISTKVATSMAFAPDGRLFVADNRTGNIDIVKNGTVLSTPFAHVSVDTYRERGLEGITLDPNFAKNGYVYAYYTHADPSNPNTTPNGAKEYLSRFKASTSNPDIADSTFGNKGEQVLLSGINSTTGVHNGGFLHFGPDGMLYLAIGDSEVSNNAQDLSTDNGKMLRLDVENFPNIIPSDNPFVKTSGAKGEIYALGFRNPFTGDIDPVTGQIMVNDVGQSTWEEVDSVQAGKNYGWPTAEGAQNKPGLVDPIYEYKHNGTPGGNDSAITGGVFYEGKMFPSAYRGKYFFADYLNKWIRMIDPTTGKETDFESNGPQIINFAINPIDGSMYGLEIGGNIYKITYNGNTTNEIPTAVATSSVTSGALPLKVNFDGSGSSDPDGDSLTYSWNFGDGSTGTGKTVSHTYTTAGQFSATMTVNDGHGGSDAIDEPIVITAGDEAPVPVISLPKTGATYAAGDTISFAGSATDPEDGTLPASAYHWSIVFHHEMHTHPFIDAIDDVKSGTFVIPTDGEVDPVQWYRVHLTVTDSQGLSVDTFTDVNPLTSTFTLASNITGATVTLDGAPEATPTSTKGVVGMTRLIAAPANFTLNGKSYQFVSWSDGGAASHNISTPSKNTTFTATFKDVTTTGAITLKPTADAYVQDGSNAGKNFGTAKTLLTKKSSTKGMNRVTYLKFDLSSVSSIGSAILKLYGDESASGSIQLAAYKSSSTSWSETGIDFNNAPASTGSSLATMTISDQTNKTRELDLTKFLQSEKSAGHSIVSIMLKGTASTSPLAQFNSRESSSNQPQLVITPTKTTAGTTLGASADAYVRGGASAKSNFGSSSALDVKLASADNAREAYLKFDLSSISKINTAKLRLFGSLSDVTASNIETDVFGASDTSWSESSIDYNNRPATSGGKLASVKVANAVGAWYEFDVSAYLKAQKAAGKTSVTLVLKNAVTASPTTSFNSKEATTNRPQLVIT